MLKTIAIYTLIFVIVIFVAFKTYSLLHRPFVHHLSADMQLIGIIGTDNSHEITSHAILNGEESVLIVDHANLLYQEILQKIPQAIYLTPEEIFSVNNLHLLDKTSNGKITEKDPIFQHLFVIHFYNNGEQNDIKSLSLSGIKGIYLNNVTPTGKHLILMSDGSTRTLYSVTKFEKSD